MSFIQYKKFKQVAEVQLDAIAVENDQSQFSYSTLINDIHFLSDHLERLLGNEEQFVGLNIDASYAYIASLLAVNKLRKIFVPMGTAYPAKRIQSVVTKTGLQSIVTIKGIDRSISKLLLKDYANIDFVCPSGLELTLHTFSNSQNLEINTDGVAYLLSTSGSTGDPKLILGSEKGLDHFIDWQIKEFNLNRICGSLLSPVTFDVSLRDIFTPLLSGGKVVVPEESTRRDPHLLLQWFKDKSIRLSHMVPTIMRGLLSEALTSSKQEFVDLEYLFLAGEPLYKTDVEQWRETIGEHVQLVNLYGPSETSLAKLYHRVDLSRDYPEEIIPLGKPLPDTEVQIRGDVKELCIKTAYCSKGYLDLAEEQARVFLNDDDGAILYLTGDLATLGEDGLIYFKGRKDHQVKLRGQRIELLEVESAIKQVSQTNSVVAAIKQDIHGEEKLVAYIAKTSQNELPVDKVRLLLQDHLPDYMLPSVVMYLDALPTNTNGKVDRKKLPELLNERPVLSQIYIPPVTNHEKNIVSVWEKILGVKGIGVEDNFFDLGGTSNQVVFMIAELREIFSQELSVAQAFQFGTVKQLSDYLEFGGVSNIQTYKRRIKNRNEKDIAIVGMALNVPGADNLETFWQNLLAGKDSITHFSNDELHPSIPEDIINQDNYVAARGVLNNAWEFDAEFFKFSKREAEILDPQQRALLQLSQHALENACLKKSDYQGLIGVFAGVGDNSYYNKVLLNHESADLLGDHALRLANEKDYVASRIAHTLNLKGMAISVHTACSTSLVAICQAVEALRAGTIDAALSGGAYIPYPQNAGYLYTEGGFASKDGRCRPFDAGASGTLFSSGAGMVVLKRLSDALAEGDRIYATIKGVGVNNDGGGKMSFMSPSVDGQSAAVKMAVDDANIQAELIDYIETHGTATPLGDPIEVEALSRVYRKRENAYRIGSVKGNIGHLDAAAGVVGLIKAALSLSNEKMPASINYASPNLAIPFEKYGIEVNAEQRSWLSSKDRYAAVSAFGVGGTNAHVVLEQAPQPLLSEKVNSSHILLLSANSEGQLDQVTTNTQNYIKENKLNLSDVAYTLSTGREDLAYKRFVVCKSTDDAIRKLADLPLLSSDDLNVNTKNQADIGFLFPGQGSQYVGMGEALYETEQVYKQAFDECVSVLYSQTAFDIKAVIYPHNQKERIAAETLINQTQYTQLALFVVGYALSKLWSSWGIKPCIMLGHSIGEYVAACLSGIFSLQDALLLVSERGRLMQSMQTGDMLSVELPEQQVEQYLNENVSIAAVNGDALTVVAGETRAIEAVSQALENVGVTTKKLMTSHAFHSHMMEPMLSEYENVLKKIKLHTPNTPIVSSSTGHLLSDEEATSTSYWVRHIRQPVRFAEAIKTAWQQKNMVFLELGPRTSATALARQQIDKIDEQYAVPSLGKITEEQSELDNLNYALGQLWLRNIKINWLNYFSKRVGAKITLPGSPLLKTEYRLDIEVQKTDVKTEDNSLGEHVTTKIVIDNITALLKKITASNDLIQEKASFLELGIDSLGLTQFSLALQKKYNVPVSMTGLLGEFNNSEKLGKYIFSNLDVKNEQGNEVARIELKNIIELMNVDEWKQKNLRIGVDENGNPHWYKKDPDVDGRYSKLNEEGVSS